MNYIIKINELTLKTLDRHILFLRKINIPYSVKLREKIIVEIDNVYSIIYSVESNIIYVYYNKKEQVVPM